MPDMIKTIRISFPVHAWTKPYNKTQQADIVTQNLREIFENGHFLKVRTLYNSTWKHIAIQIYMMQMIVSEINIFVMMT